MDDEYALELEDDDPPPAGMYAITNQASLKRDGPDAPYGCALHAVAAAACAMAPRHGSSAKQCAGQPPPAKQPRLESNAAAVVAAELTTSAQSGQAASETDASAGCDAARELDMGAPENAAGVSALQRAAARAKGGISPSGGGHLPPPDAGRTRPSAGAATLRRVESAAPRRQQQPALAHDAPSCQPSTAQTQAAGRTSAQRQDLSGGRPQGRQQAGQPLAAQPLRSRDSAASQPPGRQPAAQSEHARAPSEQQPAVDERSAVPRRGHATAVNGSGGLPAVQQLQQQCRDGCSSQHPAGLPAMDKPQTDMNASQRQCAAGSGATKESRYPKALAAAFHAADRKAVQNAQTCAQAVGAPAHDWQPQRRLEQRPGVLTQDLQRRQQPPVGRPTVGLQATDVQFAPLFALCAPALSLPCHPPL